MSVTNTGYLQRDRLGSIGYFAPITSFFCENTACRKGGGRLGPRELLEMRTALIGLVALDISGKPDVFTASPHTLITWLVL